MENAQLIKGDIGDLMKMENKIIRKAYGLMKTCHISSIFKAMKIEQLDKALEKREITFLRQLITNEKTREVILKLKPKTITETLQKIAPDFDITNMTTKILIDTVNNKIKQLERNKKYQPLSNTDIAVKYCLFNRTNENMETVKIFIDPRTSARDR